MSHRFFFIPFFFILLAGCDNSFDPKQDFEERIVVFTVLNSAASMQVVRLERTYDADGTNPDRPIGKREVTEALVSMRNRTRVFSLKDTLMEADPGVFKKVWITREISISEGETYHLSVNVPGKSPISAQATVPSKSFLQMLGPDPAGLRGGVELRAGAVSSVATPRGYYFRLWVTGRKLVNGQSVDVRLEVPKAVNATGEREYTKPSRDQGVEFSVSLIAEVRQILETREGASNIQLVGIGYSLDAALYAYYKTVRGFDDPISVRQDNPDFTNIVGGVGVFGALTPDSLRLPYTTIIPQ